MVGVFALYLHFCSNQAGDSFFDYFFYFTHFDVWGSHQTYWSAQSAFRSFCRCLLSCPLEVKLTVTNPRQSRGRRALSLPWALLGRWAATRGSLSHITVSHHPTAQITMETRHHLHPHRHPVFNHSAINSTFILTQNWLKPCASTTLLWNRAAFSAAAAPVHHPVSPNLSLCSLH